jgi:hypothetical protein
VRRGLLIFVGVVAAVSGCKRVRERAAKAIEAQRAVEDVEVPPPVLRGAGLRAGTYRITDLRIEIAPAKRGDQPWDDPPGREPDPQVTLRADGAEVARCEVIDALRLHCRPGVAVAIDADTAIDLDAWDDDALVDDRIGTATLRDPSRWDAGREIPMTVHGRLLAASIVLEAPPSWWDLHRSRMIGLAGGIAAALLMLGAFRRQLLARDPEPPPPPRCAHCGGLQTPGAVVCGHCGAKA